MLKVSHNHFAGFYSCCSVKLHNIVAYFNEHKKVPDMIDSSELFYFYKPMHNKVSDITFEYFKEPSGRLDYSEVKYEHSDQVVPYKTLNLESLKPLLKLYFEPSTLINEIVSFLEHKYKIDYANLCVLFHRGNDKATETKLCTYSDYKQKALELQRENPTIRFLLQSDETEFLHEFSTTFPGSLIFHEEIRHIKKADMTVDIVYEQYNNAYSKLFMAIMIIMSKCKYIVFGSGNCSIWIVFYRGHMTNVYQNLNGEWV